MNREQQKSLLAALATGVTIGYQNVLAEDSAVRLIAGIDERLGKTGHGLLLVSLTDPNPDLEPVWEHVELIGGDHE